MTIFAVWTATKVTFAMKIAILTILTPLVGSMRNPMTPHNHVLAMAGCDKWPGSSFSPILDNCHRIYPLKSVFFSWKRLFWPFCPFWWPPCATPWPHSTFFCNGQYWQVFLCRIPLRYWKSFHFFSFFFLYEYEVSWISRFWPFTLIYSPPMGAPTQCMPILVADTLVGAKYLKNCIPNWHFHWFLKKTCDTSVWPFLVVLGLWDPLWANMGIAGLIRLAHMPYFCSLYMLRLPLVHFCDDQTIFPYVGHANAS